MTRMTRWAEGMVALYILYAGATLVHNLYLRFVGGTEVCINITCLENLGETVVWSLIWPLYWVAYLGPPG